MSSPAIRVSHLGKRYQIRHLQQRQQYTALRDVLADKAGSMLCAPRSLARRLWRALRPPTSSLSAVRSSPPATEDFWALQDVSFEVRPGEMVGIIGRNGAGKSTLLKILSRITDPTTGRVEIDGRIASLLEVGTGFHPELTGRENIYLNGAILGMTRIEIRRKFDEIVAFAEVEKFLDTPVKRYSSGMYVRLAFAVAAHLEPEILIVDEVLAVGDAQFQQKCIGKMGEVVKAGRTVLFVSHNMAAIENLCPRCILLKQGTVEVDGPAAQTLPIYLADFLRPNSEVLAKRTDREGVGTIRLVDVQVSVNNRACVAATTGKPCTLRFDFMSASKANISPSIAFTIRDSRAQFLSRLSSDDAGSSLSVAEGRGAFLCHIQKLPLIPGQYRITPTISINGEVSDYIEGAFVLNVEGGDFYGTGRLSDHSPVLLDHAWEIHNS
jgi:lipopolysaccharide transport system ATP-binding protein